MSLNDKLWNWLGEKPKGDFTTDLSLCFKWLVPKLHNLDYPFGFSIAVGEDAGSELFSCCLEGRMLAGENRIVMRADAPALALCLAIEKLIDNQPSPH